MSARGEPLESTELEEGGGSSGRRRRWLMAAALALLLVLALVLPPLVNLGHYRRSITASISEALGRPVFVGGMQLRLLPTPGIAMSDLTVEEDPGFGYAPALHADSVVASLRLSSLWRGRLEVSRISLDEASLNLVRNSAGQWNIGSILLRASQIPNAPTGERHAGALPRFPYIEASDARINFKEGREKKPFSLMNAEFSMWQASGGEWRLRLQAQPVRTDRELHLYDTGTLRVEGSLRRAANLRAMPVNLHAEWSGAQLGQVSRLIAGFDSGWRGALDATATIRGVAGDLQLESRVRIQSLQRQEFEPATTLDIDARCRSEYRQADRLLGNITCFWPIGGGHLLLTGNVQGFALPGVNLRLELNQISAEFFLTALGLMRPHAQNVTATGTMNGSFTWGDPGVSSEDAARVRPVTLLPVAKERDLLGGEATATGVTLSYPGGELALPTLHFTAGMPPAAAAQRKKKQLAAEAPADNAIALEPAAVTMGETKPLVVDARLTRADFKLHLSGDASLARLMAMGGNFGLLENALSAATPHGHVTVDTTTTGNWMPPLAGGGSGIETSGTLQVKGAQLRPGFLRAPVEVETAELDLTPQEIAWKNAAFRYEGMSLEGSLAFAAVCNQTEPCPATFALRAKLVDAAGVEKDLAGAPSGFLGKLMADALGGGSSTPWPPLSGSVACDTLMLARLPLHNVAATVTVEGKQLTVSQLEATALGGAVHASGSMTVEDGTPHWKVDVRVTGAQASAVGALLGMPLSGGLVSGETNLSLTGYQAGDLASSASGDYWLTWQNGSMGAEKTAMSSLQRFDRWAATGTIAHRVLTVTGGTVTHAVRTHAVRGTIGFDGRMELTVQGRVKN